MAQGNNTIKLRIYALVKGVKNVLGLNKAVDDLGKESRETSKETDKLDRSIDSAAHSANRSETIFTKSRVALAAFGVAVYKVVQSTKEWVAAANVQARAEAKLEHTMRSLVGASDEQIQALKDQASALQQLTGYGDEQTISAQAMLGTFQLSAQEIQKLTPRLLDMAEATRKAGNENADLEQIAIAVGKAFTDGIGSLTRYGVALSDAQKEAFKTASQAEKVRIITEALDANFGGLAKTVGQTYEGAMRRATAAHGDFQEVLGKQITDNQDVASATDAVANAWDEMSAGIVASSGEISEAVSFMARIVKGALGGVQAAWNAVQITVKSTVLVVNEGVNLINKAMAKITFGDVSKEWQNAVDELEKSNQELRDSIGEDVADIELAGRKIIDAYTGVSDSAAPAAEATKELGDQSAETSGKLDDLGESARNAAGKVQTADEAFREYKETLDDLGKALSELTAEEARAAASYLTGIENARTMAEVNVVLTRAQEELGDNTRIMTAVTEQATEKAKSLAEAERKVAEETKKAADESEQVTKKRHDEAIAATQVTDSLSKNYDALLKLEKAYREGVVTLEEYYTINRDLIQANIDIRNSQHNIEKSSRDAADGMRDLGEAGAKAGENISTAMKDAANAADEAADSIRKASGMVEEGEFGRMSETVEGAIPAGIGERQQEIALQYGHEAADAFMQAVLAAINAGITDVYRLLDAGNRAAIESADGPNSKISGGFGEKSTWQEDQVALRERISTQRVEARHVIELRDSRGNSTEISVTDEEQAYKFMDAIERAGLTSL